MIQGPYEKVDLHSIPIPCPEQHHPRRAPSREREESGVIVSATDLPKEKHHGRRGQDFPQKEEHKRRCVDDLPAGAVEGVVLIRRGAVLSGWVKESVCLHRHVHNLCPTRLHECISASRHEHKKYEKRKRDHHRRRRERVLDFQFARPSNLGGGWVGGAHGWEVVGLVSTS